jgi:hypothetical protein
MGLSNKPGPHQFLVSDYKPVLVFQQSIVQSPIFISLSLLTEFLK